jgi:DNA (cytosine-5)-methyltransferase 1
VHDNRSMTAPHTDHLPAGVEALPERYTAISTYSGAGGMDLGFWWAGIRPVWANDFFEDATRTYAASLAPHAHAGDILQAPFPDVQVDVVIGGPPCQGFSVAGRMDPGDERSQHVFHFMDVVERYRPRAFVMENVKNLAINEKFELIRERLFERGREMGYHVELMLLNAADYGVPQARERMFLVGCLDRGVRVPAPTHEGRRVSVREGLAALPELGQPGNSSICRAKITPAKSPVLRVSPWAGMLFNGAGRPINLEGPAPTLPASMGGNRTPIIDQRQWDEGGESWVQHYHRSLMDGGDPITEADIPSFLRRLTVEEAAALQTFPASYRWQGPQSAQFKQIGNAVPPVLAWHVAKAVREALAGD